MSQKDKPPRGGSHVDNREGDDRNRPLPPVTQVRRRGKYMGIEGFGQRTRYHTWGHKPMPLTPEGAPRPGELTREPKPDAKAMRAQRHERDLSYLDTLRSQFPSTANQKAQSLYLRVLTIAEQATKDKHELEEKYRELKDLYQSKLEE